MEGTLTLRTRIDLTGKRFGLLKVIERAPAPNGRGGSYWLCHCDCGRDVVVRSDNLRGHTRGCGCLVQNRKSRKGLREPGALKSIWVNMIQRCFDPKCKGYRRYGGRGISVYEPWTIYAVFERDVIAEIGYRPSRRYTIDRIDPDGNYEPGNIRWATAKQQANNKSKK